MNTPKDEEKNDAPSGGDSLCEDYLRSRREGAFISPFGTEGCQWDGFPEAPWEESEPDVVIVPGEPG